MQTVRKQLNELTEREEREIRGKNDKIKQLQEELEDLKRQQISNAQLLSNEGKKEAQVLTDQIERDAKKISSLETLLDNTAVEMLELKGTVKKQKEELVIRQQQVAKEMSQV